VRYSSPPTPCFSTPSPPLRPRLHLCVAVANVLFSLLFASSSDFDAFVTLVYSRKPVRLCVVEEVRVGVGDEACRGVRGKDLSDKMEVLCINAYRDSFERRRLRKERRDAASREGGHSVRPLSSRQARLVHRKTTLPLERIVILRPFPASLPSNQTGIYFFAAAFFAGAFLAAAGFFALFLTILSFEKSPSSSSPPAASSTSDSSCSDSWEEAERQARRKKG
jgi:hypothetical protein